MNLMKRKSTLLSEKLCLTRRTACFWTVTAAILMIFACFPIMRKEMTLEEYPVENIRYSDIYIKQFDAFMKGQVYLDIEPDARLEELENPYDRTERDSSGAPYLWDHAYFEGRYYSYFGIAPILTIHAPIYLVTGKLPGVPLMCMMLAVIAVIFTCAAYREVVFRFCEQVNALLYVLGLFAVISTSGVSLGLLCADMYYVAVLSAQVYSMSFVFLGVRAMRSEKTVARMILLFGAAISLVLTVWSRPTVALMCAAIFPLFAQYLLRIRRETLKAGILSVVSFALPLAAGGVAMMLFNYARFGSPFDFGANYQLTVSDVSQNTLRGEYFFSSFFSYFICPVWPSAEFPFMEMQKKLVLPDGASYIYAERSIGVLTYVLPMAIALYPCLRDIDIRNGKRDFARDVLVGGVFVLSVVVAFSDFCLGGVNMRYIYDLSPFVSLVSAAVLLALDESVVKIRRIAVRAVSVACFAAAVYVNIAVLATIARVL